MQFSKQFEYHEDKQRADVATKAGQMTVQQVKKNKPKAKTAVQCYISAINNNGYKQNRQNPNFSNNMAQRVDRIISGKFQKIVEFLKWSEVEVELLSKYEQLLDKQLHISNEQLALLLSTHNIDTQLHKNLMKCRQQIKTNLISFYSNIHNFQQYQANIQCNAVNKITVLMKTASRELRALCEALVFLHFVSTNMDRYDRIITYFQNTYAASLVVRQASQQPDPICILKYRVYTVVSLLYIKYNKIDARQLSIGQKHRQTYGVTKHDAQSFQKYNSLNSHKAAPGFGLVCRTSKLCRKDVIILAIQQRQKYYRLKWQSDFLVPSLVCLGNIKDSCIYKQYINQNSSKQQQKKDNKQGQDSSNKNFKQKEESISIEKSTCTHNQDTQKLSFAKRQRQKYQFQCISVFIRQKLVGGLIKSMQCQFYQVQARIKNNMKIPQDYKKQQIQLMNLQQRHKLNNRQKLVQNQMQNNKKISQVQAKTKYEAQKHQKLKNEEYVNLTSSKSKNGEEWLNSYYQIMILISRFTRQMRSRYNIQNKNIPNYDSNEVMSKQINNNCSSDWKSKTNTSGITNSADDVTIANQISIKNIIANQQDLQSLQSSSNKVNIQLFFQKMNYYQDLCQSRIKQIEVSQINTGIIQQDIIQKTKQQRLFKIKGNKLSSVKSQVQCQIHVNKHQVEGQMGAKPKYKCRSSSVRSSLLNQKYQKQGQVIDQDHKYNSINQQLNELFFSSNKQAEKKRKQMKSVKAFFRQRSKSRIMANILSNTFENAKNALKQIQLQIKTNVFGNKRSKSVNDKSCSYSNKQSIQKLKQFNRKSLTKNLKQGISKQIATNKDKSDILKNFRSLNNSPKKTKLRKKGRKRENNEQKQRNQKPQAQPQNKAQDKKTQSRPIIQLAQRSQTQQEQGPNYYKKLTNKQTLASISKQSLLQQISKIKDVIIYNSLKTIEQNKRCIIQHKIVHRDVKDGCAINGRAEQNAGISGFGYAQLVDKARTSLKHTLSLNNDNSGNSPIHQAQNKNLVMQLQQQAQCNKEKQKGHSQQQTQQQQHFQKLSFIKLINQHPYKIKILLTSIDKNYILKINLRPFGASSTKYDEQLSFDLELPKSNNIFRDKYQTTWPSIRYILSKKLLKFGVFKDGVLGQYTGSLGDGFGTLCASNVTANRQIKQQKIIQLFGPIIQLQFTQICATLGLISKFIDLFLHSSFYITGKIWEFYQLNLSEDLQKKMSQLYQKNKQMHKKINNLDKKRPQINMTISKSYALNNLNLKDSQQAESYKNNFQQLNKQLDVDQIVVKNQAKQNFTSKINKQKLIQIKKIIWLSDLFPKIHQNIQKNNTHRYRKQKQLRYKKASARIKIGSLFIKQRGFKLQIFDGRSTNYKQKLQSDTLGPYYYFVVSLNLAKILSKDLFRVLDLECADRQMICMQTQLQFIIEIYNFTMQHRYVKYNQFIGHQNKQNESHSYLLHKQIIILSARQQKIYNICSKVLLENINKTILNKRMDLKFQQRLLQVIWIKFSKWDDFYMPWFFDTKFIEINQPWVRKVCSRGLLEFGKLGQEYLALAQKQAEGQGTVVVDSNNLTIYPIHIKVSENTLQENFAFTILKYQNKNNQLNKKENDLQVSQFQPIEIDFDQASTTKKFMKHYYLNSNENSYMFNKNKFNNKFARIEKAKIIQSFNLQKKLNLFHSTLFGETSKNKEKRNCMTTFFNLSQRQINQRYQIRLQFLTPFCQIFNWLLQISVFDTLKSAKYLMVISAEDFYTLKYYHHSGFPTQTINKYKKKGNNKMEDIQKYNHQGILKQIEKLCKHIELDRKSLIPKLVFCLQFPCQMHNKLANISIDKHNSFETSKINSLNRKLINNSDFTYNSSKNNIKYTYNLKKNRYRSSYLSKKYKYGYVMYHDKPYFETSSNLTSFKNQHIGGESYNIKNKSRKKNKVSIKINDNILKIGQQSQKDTLREIQNNYHGKLPESYLIKNNQFQLCICTAPKKLSVFGTQFNKNSLINSRGTKKRQNYIINQSNMSSIYGLITLKYIFLDVKNQFVPQKEKQRISQQSSLENSSDIDSSQNSSKTPSSSSSNKSQCSRQQAPNNIEPASIPVQQNKLFPSMQVHKQCLIQLQIRLIQTQYTLVAQIPESIFAMLQEFKDLYCKLIKIKAGSVPQLTQKQWQILIHQQHKEFLPKVLQNQYSKYHKSNVQNQERVTKQILIKKQKRRHSTKSKYIQQNKKGIINIQMNVQDGQEVKAQIVSESENDKSNQSIKSNANKNGNYLCVPKFYHQTERVSQACDFKIEPDEQQQQYRDRVEDICCSSQLPNEYKNQITRQFNQSMQNNKEKNIQKHKETLNRQKLVKLKKEDKVVFKEFLMKSSIIHDFKQLTKLDFNQNARSNSYKQSLLQINKAISQHYKCSRCTTPSCYSLTHPLNNQQPAQLIIPIKLRFYHQYDPASYFLYDVYLHSPSWQIQTCVNSGVGVGAEVDLDRICDTNHFQLVRSRMRQPTPDGCVDRINSLFGGVSGNKQCRSIQMIQQQIAVYQIHELVKLYKLEHMETIHLDFNDKKKNTIYLITLAEFIVKLFIENNSNSSLPRGINH